MFVSGIVPIGVVYKKSNKKNTIQQKIQNQHFALQNFSQNVKKVSFGLVPPIPPVPVDPLYLLVITALEFWGLAKLAEAKDKVEKKQNKNKQVKFYNKELFDVIQKDVEKYAKRYNLSIEQAKKEYAKNLKTLVSHHSLWIVEDDGLNAIKGHELERFQLLTNVVGPLVRAKENPDMKKNVPNGLLYIGYDGKFKDAMRSALRHHLVLHELAWEEFSMMGQKPYFALQNFSKILEQAKTRFDKGEGHTVIHIKDIEKVSNSKDRIEFDILKNSMEKAADNGVMFFMETTDVRNLDRALLRPGRCDVKIYLKDEPVQENLENNVVENKENPEKPKEV